MTSTKKHPKKQAPKQQQVRQPQKEQGLVNVLPAKIISDQRSQSHYIIDALTKTATNLASADDAHNRVEIMERLWAMQKEAENRQAEREFGIAKVAVAMALPDIPKTKMISFIDKNNQKRETPYADRKDIESVLDPICRMHGFSKEYSTDTIDGKAAQVLTVRHVGGHKEVYKSPYMPLDTTGSKNNNQAAGSTSEYGKRYALIGAFNVIGADKDDDGNGGEEMQTKGDKFRERAERDAGKVTDVADESGQPTAKEKAINAADTLEKKLTEADSLERRGEILMQNVKLLKELETHGETDRVATLRALAEGK